MAFADPQTVTINSVAQTLARTGTGPTSGIFAKDDGTVKLSVAHAVNKRARRTIRLDHEKVVPDPLFPASNVPRSMSVYLVVDGPLTGYSIAELKQNIDGFLTYLSASSGAKITQLLGGEN